jgi:hypothetical protein
VHATKVVDVSPPRQDGSLTIATDGQLALLSPDGTLTGFARGAGGYRSAPGGEPYLTLTPPVGGTGCSFHQDDVFALDLATHPGIVMVDPTGAARRLADLPRGAFLDGIAFDTVGRFGHRLLVTARIGTRTTLFAVGCDGRTGVLTRTAPRVEGGIVVAPDGFGAFAGDLIAPDELTGRILAVDARGATHLVARSGVPHGGDIGVEAAGFVPAGLRADDAYLADLHAPGNPHPGGDQVLALSGSALAGAGVAPGDLLVATEGGAVTVAVRCTDRCVVRHVADGPKATHGEGHLVFAPHR